MTDLSIEDRCLDLTPKKGSVGTKYLLWGLERRLLQRTLVQFPPLTRGSSSRHPTPTPWRMSEAAFEPRLPGSRTCTSCTYSTTPALLKAGAILLVFFVWSSVYSSETQIWSSLVRLCSWVLRTGRSEQVSTIRKDFLYRVVRQL